MSNGQYTTIPSTSASIPGCPGYRASSDGTIWSCWRSTGRPLRQQRLSVRWRRLRGEPRQEDGRIRYTVKQVNGSYRRAYGSHLVLEAFIGPRPTGMEACHNDGNCLNDAVTNLRWDTALENHRDMIRHGTQVAGETHPKAKLRDSEIPIILAERRSGETLRTIGDRHGVSEQRIYQICKKGAR